MNLKRIADQLAALGGLIAADGYGQHYLDAVADSEKIIRREIDIRADK